jgi:hypothetical protein
VGELAIEAARIAGLRAEDVTTLRRSALVKDLGHLVASNAIWEKQGPLNSSEVERARLHPYLTERTLSFSPALAPLGTSSIDIQTFPFGSWSGNSRIRAWPARRSWHDLATSFANQGA